MTLLVYSHLKRWVLKGTYIGFRKLFPYRKYLIVLLWISSMCILISMNLKIEIVGKVEDRLWFLRGNRNLSAFIHPLENTELTSSNLSRICELESDRVQIVYFVTTSPTNHERRIAIRQTWGKDVKPKPIFITGFVENGIVMDNLLQEAKAHQDIITENFVDGYNNLTTKTGYILKHFQRLCPNAEYLMKTDDDMFVNTPLLHALLQNMTKEFKNRPILIGDKISSYAPHRDPESQWYLPFWLVPDAKLPSYLSGTGYIISQPAINPIYNEALQTPIIPYEDVFFTGLVANKLLHLHVLHDKRFSDSRPLTIDHCAYRDLITAHHLKPSDLRQLWRHRNSPCGKMYKQIANKLTKLIGFTNRKKYN